MTVVPFAPCRKCGAPRDERSPDQGRYSKLCADCRRTLADEIRASNARGGSAKATEVTSTVDLAEVVKAAIPSARRLQRAVETKHSARLEAQAALSEFGSTLREIRDAAQKLVNGHQSTARVDRELEPDVEREVA